MFLQPDWFEVTMPGVGTNRFAYGLGDPVNLSDPGGNQTDQGALGLWALASEWAYQREMGNTPDWETRARLARARYENVSSVLGLDDKSIIEKEWNSRPKTTRNPNEIHFSQDSMSAYFSDGRSVDQVAADLKAGKAMPGDIPAIRVFEEDGKLVSLDNRRLKAAQIAGIDIVTIPAADFEITLERPKKSQTSKEIVVRSNSQPRTKTTRERISDWFPSFGERSAGWKKK